jgi:hypothetical protein
LKETAMTDIKSGTCPKCGSNLIYINSRQKRKHPHGNAIAVNVGWFEKYAYLCHYVCASCSYIESYVADGDSMKHILEGFEPLNKKNRKRKNEG